MCQQAIGAVDDRRFDPTRCPLLQGLSNEEADRKMRTDPRLRACIAAVSAGQPDLEPCETSPITTPTRPPRRPARVA